MKKEKLILFAGPASKGLGSQIARYLNEPLGYIQVGAFSDGETSIEVSQNIRGMDVFLVQSTYQPGNEHLMQLLLMADACKRASAKSVSAVIPYFGYSRQDRRPRSTRGPVSAKLVADLIETADIKRLITVDLHADQIEGFFSIPVDNIYSSTILMSDMWRQGYQDQVIVSPDVGGVERTRALSRRINSNIAIIDKRRPMAGKSEVMNIVGNVKNKNCVIVDDIIDSGGTIVNAVKALKDKGAKDVYVYITHAVLSGEAVNKIEKSQIKKLITTDTIDNSKKIGKSKKIEIISLAPMISEAMKRIANSTSVSSLFK